MEGNARELAYYCSEAYFTGIHASAPKKFNVLANMMIEKPHEERYWEIDESWIHKVKLQFEHITQTEMEQVMEVCKKDWKLYREKIGEWQENYMDRLCKEYVKLLQSDATPSDSFWALEEQIKEDKRRPGVRIELRKGDMMFDLVRLIREEVITIDDLSDFSKDLQDGIKLFRQRFSNDNW